MAYLGNPAYTMAVLEKHGFHFQKKYGQNFLIDKNILEKIVDAAERLKIPRTTLQYKLDKYGIRRK